MSPGATTRLVYAAPGLVLRPGGGPCEHFLSVGRAMARRDDIDLHLVIGGPHEPVDPQAAGVPERATLHLIPAPPDAWAVTDCLALGAHPTRYLQHVREMRKVSETLVGLKPDALIERMWGFGGLLGKRLQKAGTRFVLEENGPPSFESRERRWTDALRGIYLGVSRLRTRSIYAKAEGILVQTPVLRDQLVSGYGADRERIRVVPNAVDRDRIDLQPCPERRRKAREALGVEPDQPVLVYCGSLDRSHHIVPVVEAFLASSAVARGARCLVLGHGFDKTRLEEIARDDGRDALRILPARKGAELDEILRAADLALAPYHLEVFRRSGFYFSSLKVRESLAFNLPVAATAGTSGDAIEDGVNGYLLGSDDEWRACFDALPTVETLRAMGAGGAQRVAGYTYDHVVERYLELVRAPRLDLGRAEGFATLAEP